MNGTGTIQSSLYDVTVYGVYFRIFPITQFEEGNAFCFDIKLFK